MSQIDQPAAGANCPNCAEPLESDDRFCGACGLDLAARPGGPGDRPTVALSTPPEGTAVPVPAGRTPAEGSVDWPEAPEVDSSDRPVPVHHGSELPGTDSTGIALPRTEEEALRHDARAGDAGNPENAANAAHTGNPENAADAAHTGGTDYPLAAPAAADPRLAVPAAPESGGGRACVACRLGRVDSDGYCENCGHAQPRERDHMEQELGAVAAVSDRGLRHHRNEDAFAVSRTALPDGSEAVVAVVCDGVSSATRPDEASLAASRAANETLLAALPRGTHPQQAMHEAILAASGAVNSLAAQGGVQVDQNAPACTLVSAVIAGELLTVGWVGDSRAYWVPLDRTAPSARLTEDDSWAAQMVANGLMTEAEAYADERAHAITGWLGADAYEVEPHTASFKPDRPGTVVVCTDGLWNYAEAAEEMARVLPPDAAERPLHSAQVLVGHALDGGGHDNVTVAVLPFPPSATGEVSA
ncbi:PP2C family serine/threonine-protein phosphatase [Streptomyces physcomitrii]|uniref:PP2C family serine/threonine-protein phosphatase n=1 Tax=Streptomyces physcomitrii TaxID=2724184 RepID=UPI0033E969E8